MGGQVLGLLRVCVWQGTDYGRSGESWMAMPCPRLTALRAIAFNYGFAYVIFEIKPI